MMNEPAESDSLWLQTLSMVLGERHLFYRFIALMLVLLSFTFLVGWLWDAAAIAAAFLILRRRLSARRAETKGDDEPNGDSDG